MGKSCVGERDGMMPDGTVWNEPLVEQRLTYDIENDRHLLLIKNVPAWVSAETGERYFAPETVERLQKAVGRKCKPVRIIQTPLCK